jgi:hypothetical protein
VFLEITHYRSKEAKRIFSFALMTERTNSFVK